MKKPKNDKEFRNMLKRIGRTDEQIDAMIDFGKLAKAMTDEPEDKFIKTVGKMKKKWIDHKEVKNENDRKLRKK